MRRTRIRLRLDWRLVTFEATPAVTPATIVRRAVSVIILLSTCTVVHGSAPVDRGPPPITRNPGISLSMGFHALAEGDMRDTYGPVPEIGVRIWSQPVEAVRFFVGARYASVTGDPGHHDPTFDPPSETKLEFLPIEIGFVTDVVPSEGFAFLFGFAGESAWVREEVAGASYADPERAHRYTGQGFAVRVLLGPEVRPSRGRAILGVEASAGISQVDVSGRDHSHAASLSGVALRGYMGVRL